MYNLDYYNNDKGLCLYDEYIKGLMKNGCINEINEYERMIKNGK